MVRANHRIRRLLAKIRKIESDFNALNGAGSTPGKTNSKCLNEILFIDNFKSATGTAVGQVRNRQEEDLISTLYAQVNQLKAKNTKLTDQNEKLTENLERKKREVAILSKVRPSSAKSGGASRKPSPSREGTANRSALVQPAASTDIEIRATDARKSHDKPLKKSVERDSVVAVAAQDENLLRIANQLKTRQEFFIRLR